MPKEMEGDNRQRRAAAAEARERGQSPSEAGVTTGASKQRRELGHHDDHADKIAGPGWGKQQPERSAPEPRPHSVPSGDCEGRALVERPDPRPDARPGELSPIEARVFETIARLESETGAVSVAVVSRDCGIDDEAAEQAVIDLMHTHDVVVELPDDPDGVGAGPVYAVKPRGS
jgi:hypothetical protein